MKTSNTIKKCTLTPVQVKYVRRHYQNLKISQLAINIFKTTETLRRNMRFLGLESPFRKVKIPIPELTAKQKVFVLSNYKKMTVTDMKNQLGIGFYAVYKFLNNTGIKAKKIKFKDMPQIPLPEQQQAPKIIRPPAVYSNPNYQTAYL